MIYRLEYEDGKGVFYHGRMSRVLTEGLVSRGLTFEAHAASLTITLTGGYVKDNVLVISNRANRAKSDLSVDELRALAEFYGAIT